MVGGHVNPYGQRNKPELGKLPNKGEEEEIEKLRNNTPQQSTPQQRGGGGNY